MNQVRKTVTKKTSGKLGKLTGALNTVLGVIPDTVAIVGKITDKTAPIVDKHLERRHDYKKSLISIPNLIDVEMETAKSHLENLGLKVIPVLAKPHGKYANADVGEVVAMTPKWGKVEPNSLIKLYYINEHVLIASQQMLADAQAKKEQDKVRLQASLYKVKSIFSKRKK